MGVMGEMGVMGGFAVWARLTARHSGGRGRGEGWGREPGRGLGQSWRMERLVQPREVEESSWRRASAAWGIPAAAARSIRGRAAA